MTSVDLDQCELFDTYTYIQARGQFASSSQVTVKGRKPPYKRFQSVDVFRYDFHCCSAPLLLVEEEEIMRRAILVLAMAPGAAGIPRW